MVDVEQVIEFYNVAVADLPDHNRLKDLRAAGPDHRARREGRDVRRAVTSPTTAASGCQLVEIPESVQQAFVAAEDKRFFEHNGVDERSVIRAFINMIADPNKRQGGSTITQQVAKNLLVGDEHQLRAEDPRNDRRRAASRRRFSKQQILEIYLNSIFLGRSAWGIDLAARSYFGKTTRA